MADGNGTATTRLARELDDAAKTLADAALADTLRRSATRLRELEESESALAQMRALLDEIAIALKGEPRTGSHRWSDLPRLVRELAVLRPDPTQHRRLPRHGRDDTDRRKRRSTKV